MQGPGCLNFSLVLDSERRPELKGIQSSYEAILGKLVCILSENEIPAERAGTSDLAIGGRKISGNAQRRKKRFVLHHGTFLYAVDPDLMGACLCEPVERPAYRGGRGHSEFLAPLPVPRESLRRFVLDAFAPEGNAEALSSVETEEIRALAERKYLCPDWTYRR